MKNETSEESKCFELWLNRDERYLSFKPLHGYEAKQFNTNAELIKFAVMFTEVGYRVE